MTRRCTSWVSRKIELSTRMLQSLKAEKRCCKELKEATDACRLAGEA